MKQAWIDPQHLPAGDVGHNQWFSLAQCGLGAPDAEDESQGCVQL